MPYRELASARAELNLPELQIDTKLQRECEAFAKKLAKEGRLRHAKNLNGVSECCINNDTPDIIKEWLNSPRHRAILLGKHHKKVGIAIVYDGDILWGVLRVSD